MEFTDALGNTHILPKGERVYKRISVYPIVFNKKGELLLYMPVYNPQWQLPGGGMDEKDESPHKTAVRECLEETGYYIEIIDKEPIYTAKQNFYKIGDKKFYNSEHLFFYAKLLSNEKDIVSEEDKDGKVSWQSLGDLTDENTHIIIHSVIKLLKDRSL